MHRTRPEEETVKQGKELRSRVGGDEELTSLRALLSVTTLGSGAFFFSAAAGGSVAITTSWPVKAAARWARTGTGKRGETEEGERRLGQADERGGVVGSGRRVEEK